MYDSENGESGFRRRAVRFFCYILFLLFPFLFLGAEEERFPVVWEPSNGAEKLWTTPLGAVYRFPLCASPDSVLYCYNHGRDPEECEFIRVLSNRIEGGILEAPFPKARKKGLREKRYVSIEFYIRAFPGCQKAESGHFDIRLLNSPQQIRGAAYESLNSILHLNSRDSHLKFTSSRLRIPSSREFDLMVPPYRRPRFSPEFEQMHSVEKADMIRPLFSDPLQRSHVCCEKNFSLMFRPLFSGAAFRPPHVIIGAP